MATKKLSLKEEQKQVKKIDISDLKEAKTNNKNGVDTDRSQDKKTPRYTQNDQSLFTYDKDYSTNIREVLEAMDENQAKLKKLIGKGIKISNFVNFEADCEQILGVEINPIIDFFVHNYPTTKDKFLLTFDDFIQITQRWADTDLLNNLNKKEEEVEYDHLEDEKLEFQTKSKDVLVLKFDKHSEKIKEIFDKYAEPVEKSKKSKELLLDSQRSNALKSKDSLREEEHEEPDPVSHVKLRHIGKILDDIAYLTGSSIMSYMEYLEGATEKKSSAKAKDEVTHYFWKKIHEQELDLMRKNKSKNSIIKLNPVLKNSESDFDTKQQLKKGSKAKDQDSKNQNRKSGEGSIDNIKKKEGKNKNETNNKNDDKNLDSDRNYKQKQSGKQAYNLVLISAVVDVDDKDKQKSKKTEDQKKSKKKVTKKVKQKVIRVDSKGKEYETEEEVEQDFYKTDSDDDNKDKLIAFEDEKYNQEKGETLLSYNMFQPYLEDFIHE